MSQAIAIYKFFPRWAKLGFSLSALGFCVTIVLHLTVYKPAFAATLFFEGALVLGTLIGREQFLRAEFGEFQDRDGPPDAQDGSEARYLLFADRLNELSLSNSHIDDCIEILDAQIERESVPHNVAEKITTLLIGMTLGLATAIFTSMTVPAILVAAVILGGVAFLVKIFVSLVPSKLQRLHELKYFLTVYKVTNV